MMQYLKKLSLPILLIAILFVPYFFRPFAINQHPDIANELMDILRLYDARFDFAPDKTTLYANFFVQLFREPHGFFRLLLLFPIFWLIDLVGIPINSVSVACVYLFVGAGVILCVYFFSKKIIGVRKALAFSVILATVPYFVMQIKAGWWTLYPLIPFVAGFYFLDKFLSISGRSTSQILSRVNQQKDVGRPIIEDQKKQKKYWSFFCCAVLLYIFANPGFIFGGLFYVLYIFAYLVSDKNFSLQNENNNTLPTSQYPDVRRPDIGTSRSNTGTSDVPKFKKFKQEFYCFFLSALHSVWTHIVLVIIVGAGAISYIGKMKFGGDYGVMSKFFMKSDLIPSYGIKTFISFISEGLGLLGFILWPLMLFAAVYFLLRLKKQKDSPLILACAVHFWIVFLLLLFVGMGSGAYAYELLFPGMMLVVFLIFQYTDIRRPDIDAIRQNAGTSDVKKLHTFSEFRSKNILYGLLAFLLLVTYGQTLAYNFGYKPDNFLTNEKYFIQRDNGVPDACKTLWCPYHFNQLPDIGIKTLGFVARDYLQASPIPYASWEENFVEKPKEFFMLTNWNSQAPTIHVGRRINYDITFFNDANVVVVMNRALYSSEQNTKLYDAVMEEMNVGNYRLVATIIKENIPTLFVYEKEGSREHKIFPVEIYDKEFDEKYSNLRSLAHIDLGS